MDFGEPGDFVRCRNCGRFFPSSEARLRYYCSDACTIRYARCANCGRYFLKPAEGNVVYCSSECGATYEVPIKATIRDLLQEVP